VTFSIQEVLPPVICVPRFVFPISRRFFESSFIHFRCPMSDRPVYRSRGSKKRTFLSRGTLRFFAACAFHAVDLGLIFLGGPPALVGSMRPPFVRAAPPMRDYGFCSAGARACRLIPSGTFSGYFILRVVPEASSLPPGNLRFHTSWRPVPASSPKKELSFSF